MVVLPLYIVLVGLVLSLFALVLSYMAYGVMPWGRPPPGFASAGRRWVVVVLLLSVFQRLEVAGGGATLASLFPQNKLAGDGKDGVPLCCSSSTRSDRHGDEGWWMTAGFAGEH